MVVPVEKVWRESIRFKLILKTFLIFEGVRRDPFFFKRWALGAITTIFTFFALNVETSSYFSMGRGGVYPTIDGVFDWLIGSPCAG